MPYVGRGGSCVTAWDRVLSGAWGSSQWPWQAFCPSSPPTYGSKCRGHLWSSTVPPFQSWRNADGRATLSQIKAPWRLVAGVRQA